MALTQTEFEALRSGATLVTATRFQAELLRHEFDRACRSAGQRAWSSPDVLPYGAWLERAFAELNPPDAPLLLGAAQCRALWRRLLRDSELAGVDGQLAALVRRADEAWRLLHDWQIPLAALPDGAGASFPEAAVFAGWAREFDRACTASRWLDGARLGAWLQPHLGTRSAPLLRGFASELPARAAVLAACGGSRIREASAAAPAELFRQQCADAMTELAAAARWAERLLARELRARIAIVLGDARVALADAARWLRRELAPKLRPLSAPDPFITSQPEPLARRIPMARALDLLQLDADDNPFERISALLTDPLLDPGTAGARALLDAKLRCRPLVPLSLDQLAREARREPALAEFDRSVLAHLAELRQGPRQRSLRDWAGCFSRILTAWHWRVGDDAGVASAWEAALDDLASIDLVLPPQSLAAARALLREQTERRLAIAASLDAPVHLLSIDDAIDLRYDYVWVCGLHEQAWPPPNRPQPWLPYALQRRARLPQCDPTARLQLARAQLAGVLAGARGAVLSWPCREGDAELRPAAQLAALPALAEPVAHGPSRYWRQLAGSVQRERYVDPGPGSLVDGATVRGGAARLDDQSACPFRAFARHRLRADPLEDPGPGFNARERGQVIHESLRNCWQQLGGQQTLRELDPAARRRLLSRAIAAALDALQRATRIDFGARFLALERERLLALLDRWLDQELTRAEFQVMDLEKETIATIGALSLRVRFDRRDRLESGDTLLIDYKTGQVTLADWLGDRPRACQLPLYAITESGVGGIAYACVSRRALGYKGLVAGGSEGPGIHASDGWDAQLAGWRAALWSLADEIHRGIATVTPQADACRHCRIDALCRIAEPRR